MTDQTDHQPLVLLVGGPECLDRECDEYSNEDGEHDPGVERCSHITEETVCAGCSTEGGEGFWDPTVPWADCPQQPAAAAAAGESGSTR